MVGVSVSLLGVLMLGGAGVGAYYLLRKDAPAPAAHVAAPVQSAQGIVVGNGVVAPIGNNTPTGNTSNWDALRQQQEAEAKRLAEWRRADTLQTLERDWATLINNIKLAHAELDSIDKAPMPADIITQVSNEHVAYCNQLKAAHPLKNWSWNCEVHRNLTGDDGRWETRAKELFDQRKATQRIPILARLDLYATQQKAILANFSELGVTKQPVNVRTS